jgi:hypothetical protein
MQNTKIFIGVFSFIQDANFFKGWVSVFWLFFLASLGQNPKWRMDTFLSKILHVV